MVRRVLVLLVPYPSNFTGQPVIHFALEEALATIEYHEAKPSAESKAQLEMTLKTKQADLEAASSELHDVKAAHGKQHNLPCKTFQTLSTPNL